MKNEKKTPKKVSGSIAKAPSESVVQTHINDHEVRLVELEKRLGEAREAVGEFDSRVSRMKNSAEEFINNALQTIPKRFDDLCLRVEKSEKALAELASLAAVPAPASATLDPLNIVDDRTARQRAADGDAPQASRSRRLEAARANRRNG